MTIRHIIRIACAGALAAALSAGGANAQARPPAAPAAPSAASLAAAKEIIDIKGAFRIFEPIVLGVIEQHKNIMMQSNPMLSRDLTEVSNRLRIEFAPRRAELESEMTRIYAQAFTEQELKELVAFYKSPLGKKLNDQEPKVLDNSMARASEWADKLAGEVVVRMRAEMRKKGHNL
jgi:hypothetical protein